MRHFIDLIEQFIRSDFTEDTHGGSDVVLKRRRVKLKDGAVATLTLSRNEVPYEAVTVVATIDDAYAGTVKFAKNTVPEWDHAAQGSWSSVDTYVSPEFRRLGLAKAMYDTAARYGLKIVPSGRYGGKLLPDGAALWDSQTRYRKARPDQLIGKMYRPRFWTPTKPKA